MNDRARIVGLAVAIPLAAGVGYVLGELTEQTATTPATTPTPVSRVSPAIPRSDAGRPRSLTRSGGGPGAAAADEYKIEP